MEKLVIADKNACTGCSACFSICKKQAISMVEDEEGFIFPKIDKEKCVNCGLCSKVCPVLNQLQSTCSNRKCFAVMGQDELREKSSSGGVFSVLAKKILEQNGYICGAVYDYNDYSVKHIIINDINDLYRMRSSKYIQSNIGNCFNEIQVLLKKEKKVLFSGTPCQVSGLLSFLGKKYHNLITVDVLCKGVPPLSLHRRYLNELLEKGEKLIYFSHRGKELGWNPYLTTTTTTTRKFYHTFEYDFYMKAFVNNLSLRNSCSGCKFATIKRKSDITIGDFWWIENYDKKLDDKKGTSLVITNSSAGSNLFNSVLKDFKLCKRVPVRIAKKFNGSLDKSTKSHRNRKMFFENLSTMTIAESVKKCLEDKFDAGIINYWWATTNYGALLTGYALQQVLNDLGYSSRLIDNKSMNLKKESDYIGTFNYDFAKKYLKVTEPCITDSDFEALNYQTKIFITGSDQVFSPKWMAPHFEKYFLEFADINAKKIAFSASFGCDENQFSYDIKTKNKMDKALKTFDYLSVREYSGVDILKNEFNCNADWIIDPVFIVNKEKFEEISQNASIDYSDKIVSYVLDKNEDYDKTYSFLTKKFNTEVITTYDTNISVENWLASIKNCRYFITDSFHGACFALIFNKPFICIINRNRGLARFTSLFKLFNISDIGFENITQIMDKENIFNNINYDFINNKIALEREFAINKLKYVLECEKQIDVNNIINYSNLIKSRLVDLDNKTSLKSVKKEILMLIWNIMPKPFKHIIKRIRLFL